MCGIINIEFDLLEFLTDSWRGLSQELGYLRDPEPRITELTEAMAHLRSKAEDIRSRIRSAERSGETQTHQVVNWLEKVEAIEEEVSKIKTDHENGNFHWSINHRAERSLAKVIALDNLSQFDIVATRRPQKGVQKLPADLPPVNPTMTSYLSQLQDFLQDDGSQIFGIWGMGGVGKTTLLLELNNELLCPSKAGLTPPMMFEHVIWVVASKDYNPRKLQQDILKCLGLTLHEDRISPAVEIRDYLEDKSFLLLLDDLWQTIELSELGIPQLTRNRTKKQKVVFTTRLQRVCGQMQARPMMNIECLNEEEAWLLFQNKVGEETLHAHPMILTEYAREVAKECDGLPLALVVIGSAMIMKKTPEEWRNAITLLKKSRPHEIEGMNDKILAKLKFSYDYLGNDNLRKCFLLCSLWPEDYSIYKTKLIECWMGHGLVDERKFDNINEAYDSGYDLIGVLQAACLLESGDVTGHDADEVVKMHDVVRDLALWIASDCGERQNRFIVLSGVTTSMDSLREVEKMSLFEGYFDDLSRLSPNCFKMETLMVLETYSFQSIVNGFFQGTPALTYLDISKTLIKELPQDIDLLRNLRYLNISDTRIRSLPMQLSNLCELKFLLLRNLQFIFIPSGMLEKLVMLSVIDMTNTWYNGWKEISSMHRDLKGLGITLKSIEDLHQLAELPNVLIWRLELQDLLVKFNEPLQLLSPLLLGSRNIHSSIQMLNIKDSYSLEVVLMACDGGDDKCSLLRLKEVELSNLSKLKEIVWRGVCPVKMLPSLTKLTIWNCCELRNLSWVIRLKSLKYLYVSCCEEMEQIINVDNGGEEGNDIGLTDLAFPSLRNLYLRHLRSLRVFGGSFKFPSLEFMRAKECWNLHALPFGKEIAVRKLKKIQGENEWWDNLDMRDDDRVVLLPYFQKY